MKPFQRHRNEADRVPDMDQDTHVVRDTPRDRAVDDRVVETRSVDTDRTEPVVARRGAAREYFGGIDVPAAFIGMLTGLAMLLILAGIVAAIAGTSIDSFSTVLNNVQEATITTAIVTLIVLFVSFLIGGWAAGRVAHFDGARNGMLAAVYAIVLMAVLTLAGAYFGDQYNVLGDINVPNVVSEDTLTTAGILGALAGIVTMLLAGALGGRWGDAYHARIDSHLLGTDEGVRGSRHSRIHRRVED